MAQKTLNAFVVIGGRVDNSFGQIGTALINLGSTVDEISSKLINFGKESVEVYRNYQDSMLEAEGALATTYGKGTRQLKSVMDQLDQAASQWAATTIFHTDDVANAINEAAHANWDLDKILEGIPATMKLAQAGGMDLSQALDYIITSTQAAGIEFEDLGQFIDVWTFAANSSAGTIQEFGDAMQRMGNTMTFTDSKEELVTLLAVLHNTGTKGAAAGTLLRNSMIRLIAPTKKASEVMAQLGLSEGDIDEAMSEANGDIDAATAALERAGFSAYDAKGDLKGFIDIYTDLNKALNGMTEEERNNVLASIFPTRTITGALAFLDAASSGFDGLYAALKAGDAAGYGQYLSELMMSGLTGDIETFNSKMEELKRSVGEELAPQIENVTGFLGGLIDKVSGMDSASFSGLVNGLEAIALSGPGLLIAGTAFRGLGFALGTHTGRIALAAIALTALGRAFDAFNDEKFAENFGNLELDTAPIQQYLDNVTAPFTEAQGKIEAYRESMNGAVTDYQNKSSELAGGLITSMVTGATLTPAEKKSFYTLGDEMYNAIIEGIGQSAGAEMESLMTTAGGAESFENDPFWSKIYGVMSIGFNESIERAKSLSQELRESMTSAFADGTLTGEEVANIQSIMQQMNDLLAMETNAANYEQQKLLMDKAQSLGIEGLNQIADMVTGTRDDIISKRRNEQAADYGQTRAYLEYMRDNGIAYEGRAVTDAYIAATLSELDSRQKAELEGIAATYDQILLSAFDNALRTSDLSGADAYMDNLVEGILGGTLYMDQAAEIARQFGYDHRSDMRDLPRFMEQLIDSLGGVESVEGRLTWYEQQLARNDLNDRDRAEMQGSADMLRRALLEAELVSGAGSGLLYSKYGATGRKPLNAQQAGEMTDMLSDYGQTAIPEILSLLSDEVSSMADFNVALGNLGNEDIQAVQSLVSSLKKQYGDAFYQAIEGDSSIFASGQFAYRDWYAAAQLMNASPAGQAGTGYTIEGGAEAASAAHTEAQGQLDSLGDVKDGVTVSGGVEAVQAELSQMQSYANSNPVRFNSTLTHGGGGGGFGVPGMAKGGRETQPTLFAEAGIPEWYIPEEHTDNTADLILAAAYNSGFDLADLAERAGARLFADGGTDGTGTLDWGTMPETSSGGSGSGDSAGGGGVMVQYSPVIHADNAEGVERALMEDKRRLKKMMEEWWEQKQLYESMVAYR